MQLAFFSTLPDELVDVIFKKGSFNEIVTLKRSCIRFKQLISADARYKEILFEGLRGVRTMPYYTIQANAIHLYRHAGKPVDVNKKKFLTLLNRRGKILSEIQKSELIDVVRETLKEIILVNRGPADMNGFHRKIYVWKHYSRYYTIYPFDFALNKIKSDPIYKKDRLILDLCAEIDAMKTTYLTDQGGRQALSDPKSFYGALYTPINFDHSNQKPFEPKSLYFSV